MPQSAAKLILEVSAGLVPGKPLPEHTRRWALTTADYERLHSKDEGLASLGRDQWDAAHGHAREYAARLMNPAKFNWVRLEWLWV